MIKRFALIVVGTVGAWNITTRTAYAIVVISGLIPTAIAWWLGYSTIAIVLAFFSGVFAGVLAEDF